MDQHKNNSKNRKYWFSVGFLTLFGISVSIVAININFQGDNNTWINNTNIYQEIKINIGPPTQYYNEDYLADLTIFSPILNQGLNVVIRDQWAYFFLNQSSTSKVIGQCLCSSQTNKIKFCEIYPEYRSIREKESNYTTKRFIFDYCDEPGKIQDIG